MKHVVVTTAVINKNDEVLILRRAEGGSNPGRWNFPGGSYDEEDRLLAVAAARETKEESDLDLSNLRFVGMVPYSHYDLFFFFCDEFEGKVKINFESSEYKWISIDEINDYDFPIDANGDGEMLEPEIVGKIKRFINE